MPDLTLAVAPSADAQEDRWLDEWLAHCRECWLRMQMLRDHRSAKLDPELQP